MTNIERDQLLTDIHADVKVLVSHVIGGGGVEGLVARTTTVERRLERVLGAASVMSVGLGVLVGGMSYMALQHLRILQLLGLEW